MFFTRLRICYISYLEVWCQNTDVKTSWALSLHQTMKAVQAHVQYFSWESFMLSIGFLMTGGLWPFCDTESAALLFKICYLNKSLN
jgi:hypothetical protein